VTRTLDKIMHKTRTTWPGFLSLALLPFAALNAFGQSEEKQSGSRLYLIAGTPTPSENLSFAAKLLVLTASGEPVPVRDLARPDEGVDSVQVDSTRRVITVASPHLDPHEFVVVRMDDPLRPESHRINYAGSGFNEYLVDIPGHGLVQSMTNSYSLSDLSPSPRSSKNDTVDFPQPRVKPIDMRDLNSMQSRRIGIDVYAGASDTPFELAPDDARFLRFEGQPGAAVHSVAIPVGTVAADGKNFTIAGASIGGVQLPPAAGARPGDMVVFHAATDELLAVTIERKMAVEATLQATVLYLYDRTLDRWSTLSVPGALSEFRAFGRWVASVTADDNRQNPRRASPGKENRRAGPLSSGFPPDQRFDMFGRYYPGKLVLFNAESGARIEVDTDEGDSEVLLISGSSVYYRVNDAVFRGEINKTELGKRTLLARDETIRDVHWAFLGK